MLRTGGGGIMTDNFCFQQGNSKPSRSHRIHTTPAGTTAAVCIRPKTPTQVRDNQVKRGNANHA